MCHGELYLSSNIQKTNELHGQYQTISYAIVWVHDANKKEMNFCASSKGSMCMC